MPDLELCYTSATDLARMVRERSVSPVQLVENSLARIEEVNPTLNCFTQIFAEEARENARLAEAAVSRGEELGPLHGVPVAIKDFAPIKGKTVTRGSHVFANNLCDENAIVVDNLLGAGAIVLGQTTTPEFTYSSLTDTPLWGVTRNPWNPEHTPGGSSGGSGAAVAAGCVSLAEGTDSGGSVRIPAAHCGIVGMKPSYGRIPFEFMPSQYDWMTSHGPLSRTVADASLFMSVCQGPHPGDLQAVLPRLDLASLPSGSRKRLALSVDLGCYEVDKDVTENLKAAAEAFTEAGYKVEEIDLGWTVEFARAWWNYWDVCMAANYGKHLDTFQDRMHPTVLAAIKNGLQVSAVELRRYETIFTEAWRKLSPLLETYDALLCPTEAIPAPSIDYDEVGAIASIADGKLVAMDMTMQFNAMLVPAISVPSGFATGGLPTGMQIVGARGRDDVVLGLAGVFERLRPWQHLRPPL